MSQEQMFVYVYHTLYVYNVRDDVLYCTYEIEFFRCSRYTYYNEIK